MSSRNQDALYGFYYAMGATTAALLDWPVWLCAIFAWPVVYGVARFLGKL